MFGYKFLFDVIFSCILYVLRDVDEVIRQSQMESHSEDKVVRYILYYHV